MQLDQRYHLTYCTNVHPGENWEVTWNAIKKYVPEIKAKVAPDQRFGLGLRLSNTASEELGTGELLQEFKAWLKDQNVYVFTMNGFPYGNFHGQRVKELVHAPDWTTPERLDYTLRLFDQLAVLLPDGMDGGISTNPVGYKYNYPSPDTTHLALQTGALKMVYTALHLYELEQRTGKYMHMDIEPEPDGLMENSDEVVAFFKDYLLPTGSRAFAQKHGMAVEEAERAVLRYLTVCYDVCHFSLAFEEPEYTFRKLESVGIGIGKVQVSAALKIKFTGQDDDAVWTALKKFEEPVYLHQVTEQLVGKVRTFPDLPELFQHREQEDFKELRAHFHVPIFMDRYDCLGSTQDHILKVIDLLKREHPTNHLEIETYTWDVLPQDMKLELADSISREMEWFINKF